MNHHSRGIEFDVIGRPAPKGSYKSFQVRSKKTGRMAQRFVPMSKYEKPWRLSIVKTIQLHHVLQKVGQYKNAIHLEIEFRLQRPKSVTKEQRPYPTEKPDGDKLLRSTCDALTDSGLITDDKIICDYRIYKRYDDDKPMGATIRIREI